MQPTLSECKLYAQIDEDYTLEDELLESMLKASIAWCESYTGLIFSLREVVELKKAASFDLKAPVDSITTVTDRFGVDVDYSLFGTKVYTLDGNVKVTYKAGYSELPEALKTAVKMMVKTLYRNREDYVVSDITRSIAQMPIGIKDILAPYSISGGLFL